jgi:hypothetical protein
MIPALCVAATGRLHDQRRSPVTRDRIILRSRVYTDSTYRSFWSVSISCTYSTRRGYDSRLNRRQHAILPLHVAVPRIQSRSDIRFAFGFAMTTADLDIDLTSR